MSAATEKKPRLNQDEASARLRGAQTRGPAPGGLYIHYKAFTEFPKGLGSHHLYRVLHVGLDADGCEPVVVYENQMFPGQVWVRRLEEWLDQVQVDHPGAGRLTVPRFVRVGYSHDKE